MFLYSKYRRCDIIKERSGNMSINIEQLWDSKDEEMWKEALSYYDRLYIKDNAHIEKLLESLYKNIEVVRNMTGQDFYNFLYNDYYVWKYTAKNRLTTTRNHLSKHKDNIADLEIVKDLLFYCYDRQYYDWCLKILCEGINGLGTAGASGLLSLLFPVQFGTVDQFVVKSLNKTKEKNKVKVMNPENLKLSDAYELETIMRNKAKQLNEIFNTDFWTPRKIDQILWSIER